jgi:MOSC domain-containing protein YiiM
MGDPSRFRSLADLERDLHALAPAPGRIGRVALIVSRQQKGLRRTPETVLLTPAGGVPGDAWGRAAKRNRDGQLTVMQIDVANLLANGQPLTLFGDNLFLDLDLSSGNLPTGTTLRVGAALLEVTPKPHNGCKKFKARFGDDALALVSAPALRGRNLRGIYMRTVESGEVTVGDVVEVLTTPVSVAG